MKLSLPEEVRRTLEKAPERPLEIEDNETHAQYVVMRRELFQKLNPGRETKPASTSWSERELFDDYDFG